MDKILKSNIGTWILLALAILLVMAVPFIPGRIDLTGEQRFTISQPARNLLSSLDEPVMITVLLQGEKLPAGFKKLQNSTASFLENCRRYSKNNITYTFADAETFLKDSIRFPLNDTAKREWLKENAVKQNEIEKGGTRAVFNYPIALLEYKGAYATVNLLQGQGNKGFLNPGASLLQFEVINNAEAQMEYNFTSAIQSLVQQEVPFIAYAMGNGEPAGPETYDLRRTLQSKYRFYLLNLQQQPYISDSIKTLLVVKPTIPFSDADKLKLDQYLMRGGHILFLVDALNAGMDSLVASGKEFTAYSRNLNLDDLLFRYGARINNDLVLDKQSDVLPQNVGTVGEQPQIELLPWPYFPLLYSNSSHPVAKNLDAVVMQFPNSVDTVQAPGIQKEILLSTSNTSRLTGAPTIVTVEILKQTDNAAAYRQSNIPLAVLLQGKFKSLFANRLAPGLQDSLKAYERTYLPVAEKEGKILVTGDGDWVLNGFSREGPESMGRNPYTDYNFANKDFLLNALEFMNDETGIMASRSRQYTLRLLDPKKLEANKTGWQWLNIGLPIFLILLAGIIYNWNRQRKFA
ncbi:MAG: gliding motility-associated ABC transporter substrate-binding protein GldG [Bacteroidota bacterium]